MLKRIFSPRPRYLVSKIVLNGCSLLTNDIYLCYSNKEALKVFQDNANRFKNIGGNSYVNSVIEEETKITIKSSPFLFVGEIKKL